MIVSVEWDFEGTGEFEAAKLDLTESAIDLTAEYTYSNADIYLPSVRVTAHRDGSRDTPYALVRNLDRVRVIVAGGCTLETRQRNPDDICTLF